MNVAKFAIDMRNELLYHMRSMNDEIEELGWKLMQASEEREEFSAQRGVINRMFPYIYVASKRMSSRAISRWLESNGVKLSAVTIAKALRNSKPYWQELAEDYLPAAGVFCAAHDIDVLTVLSNDNAFIDQSSKPPIVEGFTKEGALDSFNEIGGATEKLREWFTWPASVREACLGHAALDLEEDSSSAANTTEGEGSK